MSRSIQEIGLHPGFLISIRPQVRAQPRDRSAGFTAGQSHHRTSDGEAANKSLSKKQEVERLLHRGHKQGLVRRRTNLPAAICILCVLCV